MDNAVKVIDSEGQVLFECPIDQEDKAYQFATEMEALGVEVTIQAPSLPETLAQSLGMPKSDQQQLRESIIHEIEEHDTGCCFEKPEDNKSQLDH